MSNRKRILAEIPKGAVNDPKNEYYTSYREILQGAASALYYLDFSPQELVDEPYLLIDFKRVYKYLSELQISIYHQCESGLYRSAKASLRVLFEACIKFYEIAKDPLNKLVAFKDGQHNNIKTLLTSQGIEQEYQVYSWLCDYIHSDHRGVYENTKSESISIDDTFPEITPYFDDAILITYEHYSGHYSGHIDIESRYNPKEDTNSFEPFIVFKAYDLTRYFLQSLTSSNELVEEYLDYDNESQFKDLIRDYNYQEYCISEVDSW